VNHPRIVIGVAGLVVHLAPAALVTLGLGSCVAVVLHDAEAGIGGLAHVLLPAPTSSRVGGPEGRFASTAIPALLRDMVALGGQASRIRARLIGGASMFASLMAPGTVQVGERNIVASREALRAARVPLIGEAVGGDFGRSVEFDLRDGTVKITSYAHAPELL